MRFSSFSASKEDQGSYRLLPLHRVRIGGMGLAAMKILIPRGEMTGKEGKPSCVMLQEVHAQVHFTPELCREAFAAVFLKQLFPEICQVNTTRRAISTFPDSMKGYMPGDIRSHSPVKFIMP